MSQQRFHLPTPPAEPPSASFPVFAVLAPVVGALVLFAILQTPYVLLFAVLSPIIAVASAVDQRIAKRRHARRELERFEARAAKLRVVVDEFIAQRTEAERNAHPEPRLLLERDRRHPDRWRWQGGQLPIAVGIGELGGTLAIDEPTDLEGPQRDLFDGLQERYAARRGPVVLDAAEGIGVYGGTMIALAIARGIVAALLEAIPPEDVTVVAPEGQEWSWLTAGAHTVLRSSADDCDVVRVLTDSGDFTVAIAAASDRLPRECRIRLPAEAADAPVMPYALALHEATAHAQLLAEAASAAGFQKAGDLPARVELTQLVEQHGNGPPRSLRARFLVGHEPLDIDLVADGPHAVVGGTTGSGKSELLVSWVSALASSYSSEQLNVLLVDFKGGASFAGLAGLRHCVGLMTDLDEAGALRAIHSLRSELRYRERVLAEAGARSVDESDVLPRLVVVVDEFAAMLQELPDLHGLFVDIAARGRSLGVHLILCTQRPADAVRDALMTNCGLRICLRVNDESDSRAVVGTGDAAKIPLAARGRCVVQVSGRARVPAQSAIADEACIAALVEASATGPRPRAPYLPPLPAAIRAADLNAGARSDAVIFAVADRPAEQSQDAVQWASEDGSVIIVGGAGCGKSTLAARFAEVPAAVFVQDIEALWDVIDDPVDAAAVVIDDLDLLLMQAGDEHAHDLVAGLGRRMREGRGAGRAFVITARRANGAIASLQGLAETQIVMRMPTRQEHLLADAEGAYDPHLQPGGGWLLGERIQAVLPDKQPEPLPGRRERFELTRCAVVAGRVDELPVQLADAVRPGQVGDVIVGSPTQWEQAWGSLDAAAADRPVIAIDVTDRQLRSLWRTAVQLPICRGRGQWLIRDGRAVRIEL